MKNRYIFLKLLCCFVAFCVGGVLHAQDRIYTTDGRTLNGKVSLVGVRQIQFTRSDIPDGPVYTMDKRDVDSIVYSGGKTDYMDGYIKKRGLTENVPQLNTWTFDLLGFTFLTVSQSYERRLKGGDIGLRVPLYIGFIGGGFAGVGTFMPRTGVYYANNGNNYNNNSTYNSGGFSIATGLNPKFYLFKRRIVRAFIGPEATIGYSACLTTNEYTYNYNYIYNSYTTNQYNRYGTFTAVGKVGLSLNPKDRFNMTIDGGAGVGDQFGKYNAIGWTGLWHIGFAMGVNF